MKHVMHLGKRLVKKLVDEGHTAYFAGGWVRDLLRNELSDEIDIATSATPEQIVKLFDKTVTVGISFGVVVVVVDQIHFEISTFRTDHNYVDGRHPESVCFSNPKEDASRRDFTINGMFYDPILEKVIDYVDGEKDLKKGIIRAIGEPSARFKEDRLRMIRAVRFAARFDFEIEAKTKEGIIHHANELFPAVSMERIWQEFNKMAQKGPFEKAILMLHQLGLLQVIFPSLANETESQLLQKTRVFPNFPANCPTVLYLQELFPNAEPKERLSLCQKLKTSGKDQKLVAAYAEAKHLFFQKADQVSAWDWAQFYATPTAPLLLKMQAAKLEGKEKIRFIEQHQKEEQRLVPHIKRIVEKNPLITSACLQKEGIIPGKKMGRLLEMAEKIAVNEDLHTPKGVLERLKQTPTWTH